jgi:hypothetical protein
MRQSRSDRLMPHQPVSHYQSFFWVIFALTIGLSFTYSPGTPDVESWQAWAKNADTYGPIAGYAGNYNYYPPLASVILWVAEQVFQPLQAGIFLNIKLSIFFFLVVTAWLIWLWTRQLKVTLILYFALLLNSVALGYIDVYFAPPFILSLWMLKEGRWLGFSLSFTLATLIKWQPMIIAPFCVAYILGIHDIRKLPQVDYAGLFGKVVAPAALLTTSMLVVFGPEPVLKALYHAVSGGTERALSGNALNLNWIVTHFLHLWDPNQFGGLQNGLANSIKTSSLRIVLIPRLLFWTTYLVLLTLFFRCEKTFTNLLMFSVLGYLCYYTFNTGVHENHLFLVAILAIVLYWQDKSWRANAVILLLMANINLFLFYGVDGDLHFPRLFAGIDIALVLAVLNVLFFIYLYGAVLSAFATADGAFAALKTATAQSKNTP